MHSTYMSFWVSLTIVLCGLLIIVSILRAIVHKKMPETNGLLWLIPAIFIILGGCFPGAFVRLANALGVDYPPVVIITFAILLLFYILFRSYLIITEMSMRLQELGMQVSLLNEENLTMMRKLGDLEDQLAQSGSREKLPPETLEPDKSDSHGAAS